tara:strand:- start:2726 stop:2953 length:228 start_codon:yes stop_codon:yes gene_type:complete
MKTFIFGGLFLFIVHIPYFIGLNNEHNAIMVIQNLTDSTDSDIEDVLSIFNFPNVSCMEEPGYIDCYKSGLITMF